MAENDVQYRLELYGPGELNTPFVVFDASSPFPSMAIGDAISALSVGLVTARLDQIVRISDVVHIIFPAQNGLLCKICVYTSLDRTGVRTERT